MSEPDLHHLVETGDLSGLRAALDAGMDPRSVDTLGETLLARAASEGQLEIVRCLLERGVPADHSGPVGNSPLMAGAAAGHLEVVECLLAAGADRARGNKWGFTARDWASWPENAAEVTARLRENLT